MRIQGLGFSRDKQIANSQCLVQGFTLKMRQASVQNVVEHSNCLLVEIRCFFHSSLGGPEQIDLKPQALKPPHISLYY